MTLKKATQCVYIRNGVDSKTGAVNPPIYQTAGFSHSNPEQLEKIFKGQDFGYAYSRISNPTITDLERRIIQLDSAFGAVAVSSGLSAIFGICIVLASKSSNIVVSDSLFGGSRNMFEETVPKLGIDVRFVDFSDTANVLDSIDDDTCAVFAEIISNPKLVVPDIVALSSVTKDRNIPLIVDATLTSSVGFDAKKHGVDIITYSSTKLFSGNTGAVGGLVVDTGNYDWRTSKLNHLKEAAKEFHRFAFIQQFRHHTLNNAGFNTTPMNAFLTVVGIETLLLRYDRISSNAMELTRFFESIGVKVNYPGQSSHPQFSISKELFNGFGPLMTIDLSNKERAFSFISNLKIVQNMSNIGDNRTMVIHPASTIYAGQSKDQLAQAGVTDGLIRISVGIEDVSDLIQEFKGALE